MAVTTDPKTTTWEFFDRRQKELIDLASAMGLLGWDQQTYMPPKGGMLRGHQQSSLAAISHERLTDEASARPSPSWPRATSSDPSRRPTCARCAATTTARCASRPPRRELSLASSEGFDTWQRVRPKNDFATFRPWLEKIVGLKRQEADAVGYEEERYDALLDEYEPGTTVAAQPLLAGLRDELVPFAHEVFDAAARTTASSPASSRWTGRGCSPGGRGAIGFDFAAGRLDRPPIPSRRHRPRRLRLTTRYIPATHARRSWHPPRGRPRHLRAGPAGRALRHAAGQCRLARHPRVAVAAVGEPGRPRPAVLGALLPRSSAPGVPRRAGATCRSTTCCSRVNDVRAVVHPRRGRRGDVQPAHHPALRAGAGAGRAATCRRRRAGGVERDSSARCSG